MTKKPTRVIPTSPVTPMPFVQPHQGLRQAKIGVSISIVPTIKIQLDEWAQVQDERWGGSADSSGGRTVGGATKGSVVAEMVQVLKAAGWKPGMEVRT